MCSPVCARDRRGDWQDPELPRFGSPSPFVSGMQCICCGHVFPLGDFLTGCPICSADGYPANVAPRFDRFPSLCAPEDIPFWLTYPGHAQIGEGLTPVVDFPRLAERHGLKSLLVKNEGANPTGSHKDRMSASLVRRALDIGARKLIVASSGNAGASLAAYAANAGLGCVVVTTDAIGQQWRRSIALTDAQIVTTPDVASRWELVARMTASGECYPATNFAIPAVGSNPFAIDGLRAIAFELYLSLGEEQPTDIIVPVSRGDLLWGLTAGYADLMAAGRIKRIPHIHAAEPFPRLTRVIAGECYTGAFDGQSRLKSLGGNTVTYQALEALKRSAGVPVVPSTTDTIEAQSEFARAGLFVETSSAITLSALRILRQSRRIEEGGSVVLVATSHGYKEDH